MKYPNNYIYKSLDDDVEDILCYVSNYDDPNTQWIISLPKSMLEDTVRWFQIVMGHPGEKQLIESLQQRYHNHELFHTIDKYKFVNCQRHKLAGKVYGLLPEHKIKIAPWEEVVIFLIGPWNVKFNGHMVGFNTLTCIDTDSNLVKLILIDNNKAAHFQSKFLQSWLSIHPSPMQCVHDKDGEFIQTNYSL